MGEQLHLVLGEEELLVARAVSGVVAAARAAATADAQIPVTKVRAGDVGEGELAELLSPSLFAEDRVVVLEAAEQSGKAPMDLITAAAADPPEGAVIVVIHTGGGRAKAMVPALKKAGATVHECPPIKTARDRKDFVRAEFRRQRVRVSDEVIDTVLDAVGSSPRELASAVSQLVADTGGQVDLAAVSRYYEGRAEVRGYEIADKAVIGDAAGALELLRWAQHRGMPPVIIADALAEALHAIARVRGMGGGAPERVASELGMPPWKVRTVQTRARSWDDVRVAKAVQVAATLNGDVKGNAADADYALERAVLEVARLA